MFCYQCQETVKNQGCTVRGVCGKPEETAALQDLLVYVCKGIAVYAEKLKTNFLETVVCIYHDFSFYTLNLFIS